MGHDEARPSKLQERLNGLQIGISFCQFSKRFVHLKTGFEIDSCIFHVAEQSLIAAHIVIIDRLLQESGMIFLIKIS